MRKALTTSLALAAFLVASPAYAITAGYSTTPLTPTAQPLAYLTTGPGIVYENVAGSTGDRRSPWDTVPGCGACLYNSVSAYSSATYFWGINKTSLTMMWGSPDVQVGRNLIEFLDGLGNVVDSWGGAAVQAFLGAPAGDRFVKVTFTGVNFFNSVRLSDKSQNAFEFAFSKAAGEGGPEVPVPAALILLLSGLAGLGFVGRSRAKSA